jgi:hypothetical protein
MTLLELFIVTNENLLSYLFCVALLLMLINNISSIFVSISDKFKFVHVFKFAVLLILSSISLADFPVDLQIYPS